MEHYFTNNNSKQAADEREVMARVRGLEVRLQTDAGVFSKRGLDFGSRLLIEHVTLPQGAFVVDLGCGYGPVTAILGQVYPDSQWILADVNERAVQLAWRNTTSLGNRRRVVVSDGFCEIQDEEVDAVVLNPPIRAGKSVVYRLFAEARAHLRKGGSLWIVIQKKHGAPSAKKELERLFPLVQDVARSGGYHVFCSTTK